MVQQASIWKKTKVINLGQMPHINSCPCLKSDQIQLSNYMPQHNKHQIVEKPQILPLFQDRRMWQLHGSQRHPRQYTIVQLLGSELETNRSWRRPSYTLRWTESLRAQWMLIWTWTKSKRKRKRDYGGRRSGPYLRSREKLQWMAPRVDRIS